MQTMCEDTACGAETALTLRLSCIPWKGTSPAPSGKYKQRHQNLLSVCSKILCIYQRGLSIETARKSITSVEVAPQKVDPPRGVDSMTGFSAGFKWASLRIFWMHTIVMFAGCLFSQLFSLALSARLGIIYTTSCWEMYSWSSKFVMKWGLCSLVKVAVLPLARDEKKSHQSCKFLCMSSGLLMLIQPQWGLSLRAKKGTNWKSSSL